MAFVTTAKTKDIGLGGSRMGAMSLQEGLGASRMGPMGLQEGLGLGATRLGPMSEQEGLGAFELTESNVKRLTNLVKQKTLDVRRNTGQRRVAALQQLYVQMTLGEQHLLNTKPSGVTGQTWSKYRQAVAAAKRLYTAQRRESPAVAARTQPPKDPVALKEETRRAKEDVRRQVAAQAKPPVAPDGLPAAEVPLEIQEAGMGPVAGFLLVLLGGGLLWSAMKKPKGKR